MFISRETINEIQARCDIVDVISYHIPLKKTGKSFKCCCPFHNEKTPSFVVNPDKQIFHCFGCGVGGNVFSFIMEFEKVAFQEAVRVLADRVGISVKTESAPSHSGPSLKDQIIDVNKMAMEYFERFIRHASHGKQAQNYLSERHFGTELIKEFHLGLSPKDWSNLFQAASRKNIPAFVLEKSGLVIKSEKRGSYYDRFRNRLMFPILDVYNRVIGFGARALDDSMPKYVNTPETDVFSKGSHLYGLNWAKSCILNEDLVLVVEGYTDCIRLHSVGVKNCVATLGTALTTQHALLLKRYTENVLMLFDADTAGQSAMLRGLDVFLEQDIIVRVVSLPEGHDPDSYFEEFGLGGLERLKSKSKDFFQFKIDLLKSRSKNLDIHAKIKITNEMFLTIRKVSSEILRAELLRRLADELQLDENVILTEYHSHAPKMNIRRAENISVKMVGESRCVAEELLLKLMFHYPEQILNVRERIPSSLYLDTRYAKIVKCLYEMDTPDEHLVLKVMNLLGEGELHKIIAKVSEEEFEIEEKDRLIEDCRIRMEEIFHKGKKVELQKMIKKMEDARNYQEMNKYLKEYKVLKEMEHSSHPEYL